MAALRAGRLALSTELLDKASACQQAMLPDERVELAVAAALPTRVQGDARQALAELLAVRVLVASPGSADSAGLSSDLASLLLQRWRQQRFVLDTGVLIGQSFSAGATAARCR